MESTGHICWQTPAVRDELKWLTDELARRSAEWDGWDEHAQRMAAKIQSLETTNAELAANNVHLTHEVQRLEKLVRAGAGE